MQTNGPDAPIAGLDGKILEWILCYGCNRYGHVKKKDGIVNCPTWKEPNAPPKAVVEQVAGQGGGAVDIDALLKAAAMLDDGGVGPSGQASSP